MKRILLFVFVYLTMFFAVACFASEDSTPSTGVKLINSLELKYFEHKFEGESLENRLTRLENFFFGEVHTGNSNDRIAQISKLVKQENISVDYSRIDEIEQKLLGQTFKSDSLSTRLSRLEMKAFNNVCSQNKDFSERTDALENYLESNLGQVILSRNSQESSELIDKSFDSAIYQQAPPPANSRMLSRVAWCEEHLFGKTFPELHLLQRLHQLNSQLFPTDKENDMELMDRLDIIVREVVLRQHPAQKISSNTFEG